MTTLKLLEALVKNFYRPCCISHGGTIVCASKGLCKLLDIEQLVGLKIEALLLNYFGVHLSSEGSYFKDLISFNAKTPVHYISMELEERYFMHVFIDTSSLQESFLSHFQKLQKTPADNLWMMSDDYQILAKKADYSSQTYIGQNACDAVKNPAKLIEAFQEAKSHQNEIVSTINFLSYMPSDGVNRIHIDILYIPPVYTSGYYLAATRKDRPANAVLGRMREAMLASSDADLAGKLGLSRSVISRIRTQKKPPLDILYKIFTLKKVSIDWLITGKGKKFI